MTFHTTDEDLSADVCLMTAITLLTGNFLVDERTLVVPVSIPMKPDFILPPIGYWLRGSGPE